ncbi:tudor domain-containing protein 5 [Electrophorus electricus]|uniref:tudor domain-containing protein 5 n=1 Tax=Electrophorus electricus TaxID=8005 RepID=UPI0015CFB75F|nr:tudor domain-containing protein 5 [Electrophorus electricus]
MAQDELLSGLKKDLRSLLVSAKRGLSPEQLRRDYLCMLGQAVPLRRLGFRSMLDMVKQMPDVVQLDYAVDGSVLLKAIGDETTKGIEELVSKQRDRKSRSSARKGASPSGYPSRQRPLALPRCGPAPPAIPAQLRSQLKRLLLHGPVGLSELEARYTACFGRPLQVTHYGFYSIAEMLAAASDLIAVRQSRTGSQLILKVAVRHRPTPATMPPTWPARISEFPANSVQREKSVVDNIKSPKNVSSPKQGAAVRAQQVEPIAPVPEPATQEQTFEKSVAKLEEDLRQRILENGDNSAVSPELKDKLRKVVAGHSRGLTIHDLPLEYKNMYGEDLPMAQCGFLSVTEMVSTLSDTFDLQPGLEQGAKHLLIMEVKHNGPDPAFSQSEGGPCAESLNPSSQGYYSTCSKSAWERNDEGNETTESSESNVEIRITNKTVHQMEPIFPVAVVGYADAHAVPLDALRCQRLKPPTRRKERELVPVLVEHTGSPGHFSVRFSVNQEAWTLENMMFEMRNCYTFPEVTERYRLPDAYVRPGQVCCVSPGYMWFYRVVIHQVLSTTQVEVYYVDFGDLATVDRSGLRFLKSCYAELPAQAVPSVLVGVKPLKGIWTKDATSTFRKLCYDRTLVAAIHSYQEDILQLFLCDTHTEEDLYIHRALQAEGHGTACSPASTPIFWQFNPVTLYLREGQLEEVKEHLTNRTPSADVPRDHGLDCWPRQHPTTMLTDAVEKLQLSRGTDDLLDLPELELIDADPVGLETGVFDGRLASQCRVTRSCCSPSIQVVTAGPCGALMERQAAAFGYWDYGWTRRNGAGKDAPEPAREWQEESAAAGSASAASPVGLSAEGQLLSEHVQESERAQQPASSIHALSRDRASMCSGNWSHRPPASFMFPSSFNSPGHRLGPDTLFFSRASPLGRGPAIRMAAGT